MELAGLPTEGHGEPAEGRRFVVLLNSGDCDDDPMAAQAWYMRRPRGRTRDEFCFVCPYGPIRIERDHGTRDLRWWPRDSDVAAGLREARPLVIRFLDEIIERWRPRQLFLGGFKEGATLALDVALHDERPLAGLILWSAILPAGCDWAERAASRRGTPMLLTHCRQQPLALKRGERLRDLLSHEGCEVRWYADDHPSISDITRRMAIALINAPTSKQWLADP
jgi:predicted esterase